MNLERVLCTGFYVPPASARVAKAYGIDHWDDIARISFMFEVSLSDGREVKRFWSWDTQNNLATMAGAGQTPVTFTPYQPEGEAETEADQAFINDTYWLLFPFQLVWSNPEVSVETEDVTMPLGGEPAASRVTAAFPSEGGYTPGDTYELYFADQGDDAGDGLIDQWRYISGRSDNSLATTWEDHVRLGPIVISTTHRNADGSFELRLTDLSATLTDGATVTPQPIE